MPLVERDGSEFDFNKYKNLSTDELIKAGVLPDVHGAKAFKWFIHNAPQNVDYFLLEGTSIGRGSDTFKNETDIEDELVALFKASGKSNLIYTSGQNIDRIVSIYRACVKTDKTLVVDVYVATILKELREFAKIPYPSDEFKSLKVIYPYYTSKRLA
jgi:ribonuclease J